MLVSTLIWVYFIVLGWVQIGHFPEYGDFEVVSSNGWDRNLIIFSTITIFYGLCIWPGSILLAKIFKTKMNKWALIISLTITILDLLIIVSPAFSWLLD